MSAVWSSDLAAWGVPAVPGLAAHFALGLAFGTLYFVGLWWNAGLLANDASRPAAIGLGIGRFVLLAGVLTLTSLEGALPLLLTALGVLAARPLVMLRIKAIVP